MVINFIYILISIIIFIFVYREIISESEYRKPYSITIEIDDDIVDTDRMDVYDHLYRIKNNLYAINNMQNSLDVMYIPQIDKLIQYAIYDIHIFQDKNGIMDHHMDRSDKPSIQDLIMKIDEVIDTLADNYGVPVLKGVLTLTNLHDIIRLSNTVYKDDDDGYSKYRDMLRDEDNSYVSHYTLDLGGVKPLSRVINRANKSHDEQYESGYRVIMSNDEHNIMFAQPVQNRVTEYNEDSVGINTQNLSYSDVTYITKRDNIPTYIPFCDITKAIEDKRRRSMHLVDKNAKKGLRNDYQL